MLRFGKTELANERFYGPNKPIKIWNVYIDNIVISKFIETNNSI